MSSTAPSKRERSTNSLPSGKGLLDWVKPIFGSTVGAKFIVALTGFALTGFVITHMIGNLQIFLGAEAINEYAKKLKDLGPLLWVARIGLLAVFVVHIGLTIKLKIRSNEARPVPYSHPQTVQATLASRTMIYTGLAILFFTLFHIAHYTLGVVQPIHATADAKELKETKIEGKEASKAAKEIGVLELRDEKGRHDVYRMVIHGFTNPIIAVLYIIAQLFLMVHLSHGVASAFQSLGANTPRLQSTWRCLGWTVTLLVGGGNLAIVASVWLGVIK